MSDDQSGLLITLPAKPENVAVVRHAVAGLAQRLGMTEPGIGDLKTVVTEACMNVVVHAYPGDEPGPLQVEAVPDDGGLTVSVRDFGGGIRPNPAADGDERQSLKIGLTLIAALSGSFAISGGIGHGTEVTMRLAFDSAENDGDAPAVAREIPDTPAEGAELSIVGQELIAPVLERVIGALAARHQISVDRLNDALLIADAVSDQAERVFEDERARFAVADGDGGLDLRVGPLPAGAGEKLRQGLKVPDVGGSLETLADEVVVEADDAGEYLTVRFYSLVA
jgi:serine/threonine-protein kinase RsbW